MYRRGCFRGTDNWRNEKPLLLIFRPPMMAITRSDLCSLHATCIGIYNAAPAYLASTAPSQIVQSALNLDVRRLKRHSTEENLQFRRVKFIKSELFVGLTHLYVPSLQRMYAGKFVGSEPISKCRDPCKSGANQWSQRRSRGRLVGCTTTLLKPTASFQMTTLV